MNCQILRYGYNLNKQLQASPTRA